MLCIVVGHIGIYAPDGTELSQPWLYQFHVPVFFVIAGCFLGTRQDLPAFIAGKARRLLLPYLEAVGVVIVGTGLLDLACADGSPAVFSRPQDALVAALYGSGSWYNVVPAGVAPIGALWFLPALFAALVTCRVLLRWRWGLWATLPLAALCLASARVFWLPFSLQSGGVGALFIAFGYALRQGARRAQQSSAGRAWHRFCASVLPELAAPPSAPATLGHRLLAAALVLFVFAGICNWKLSIASLLTAAPIPLALLTGASSSLLLLAGARSISSRLPRTARVLSFCGRNSLQVLCIHLVLLDLGFGTLLAAGGLTGNILGLLDLALQIAVFSLIIVLAQAGGARLRSRTRP